MEKVEIRVLVDAETRDKLAKAVEKDPRHFSEKAGELLQAALKKS